MDTWIKPFEMGMTCYDKQAKDIVHITNGNCTLDHSSPDAFKASHTNGGCIFAPSEAAALRVVGVTKTGDPIIAFTYRGVSPEHLTPMTKMGQPDDISDPFKLLDRVRRSRNGGRV